MNQSFLLYKVMLVTCILKLCRKAFFLSASQWVFTRWPLGSYEHWFTGMFFFSIIIHEDWEYSLVAKYLPKTLKSLSSFSTTALFFFFKFFGSWRDPLRAFAALPKDQSSVPSTYLISPVTPTPGVWYHLLVSADTHTHMYIHTNNKK